jgi:hypothetical protein
MTKDLHIVCFWVVITCCLLIGGLARRRQRKHAFLSCPRCEQEIPQQYWGQFTTRAGMRKAVTCLNCGVRASVGKMAVSSHVGCLYPNAYYPPSRSDSSFVEPAMADIVDGDGHLFQLGLLMLCRRPNCTLFRPI